MHRRLARAIERCDLPFRVHTRVGAARAVHLDGLAGDRAHCPLELTLHGRLGPLALPTRELVAVVGHAQADSLHGRRRHGCSEREAEADHPAPAAERELVVDDIRHRVPELAVADALVEALEAARGEAAEEEAALRAAIEGYPEIAEAADSGELGLTACFAEGNVESRPALQRVPGASDADLARWRDLLIELTDED